MSETRDIRKIINVNNKQKRSKNWDMRDATLNFPRIRSMGPKLDELSPILKIAFDPRQSSIPNTIVLQFLTQYFMINNIKRIQKESCSRNPWVINFGRNLARQIWPYIGEVITDIIGNVSRIANFHSIFGEDCRIRWFSDTPVDHFIENFPCFL